MPGCVLRISGIHFNPEAFLATSQLKPYLIMHQGEIVAPAVKRAYETNGFCCEVSESDTDLPEQIQQAKDYLLRHRADLEALANNEAVQDRRLDFGYACRLNDDIAVQSDYLSPEFIYLAGSLKIGIELSLYSGFIQNTSPKAPS